MHLAFVDNKFLHMHMFCVWTTIVSSTEQWTSCSSAFWRENVARVSVSVVEHWLDRKIAQWVHHEALIRRPIALWANALTMELHLAPLWLEREIAQWVHHEGSIRRPIAPQSYISLPSGWNKEQFNGSTPIADVLTIDLHLVPIFISRPVLLYLVGLDGVVVKPRYARIWIRILVPVSTTVAFSFLIRAHLDAELF